MSLEFICTHLSGPLSSIYDKGECEYVFNNKENRFPGVKTVEDFRSWCLDLVQKYKEGILSKSPKGKKERVDQKILLEMAFSMEEASKLAYKIIQNR